MIQVLLQLALAGPGGELPASAWPYVGGGLLVLWTLREVVPLFSRESTTPRGLSAEQCRDVFRRLDRLLERVEASERHVRELHAMHDHTDEDGVYVWHVRRSLVRAIGRMESTNAEALEVLREQAGRLERVLATLEASPPRARRDRPGDPHAGEHGPG